MKNLLLQNILIPRVHTEIEIAQYEEQEIVWRKRTSDWNTAVFVLPQGEVGLRMYNIGVRLGIVIKPYWKTH